MVIYAFTLRLALFDLNHLTASPNPRRETLLSAGRGVQTELRPEINTLLSRYVPGADEGVFMIWQAGVPSLDLNLVDPLFQFLEKLVFHGFLLALLVIHCVRFVRRETRGARRQSKRTKPPDT